MSDHKDAQLVQSEQHTPEPSTQVAGGVVSKPWGEVDIIMKRVFKLREPLHARYKYAHEAALKTVDVIEAQLHAATMRMRQMETFFRMSQMEVEEWADKLRTAKDTLQTLGPNTEADVKHLRDALAQM